MHSFVIIKIIITIIIITYPSDSGGKEGNYSRPSSRNSKNAQAKRRATVIPIMISALVTVLRNAKAA